MLKGKVSAQICRHLLCQFCLFDVVEADFHASLDSHVALNGNVFSAKEVGLEILIVIIL